MSSATLVFAETLHPDNDTPASCLSARSTAPSLHDLQQFPPLSCNLSLSGKLTSRDDGWELLTDQDELLSCDSTNSAVWIKHRTYAEMATQAGVEHYPIKLPASQHIKTAIRHLSHGDSDRISALQNDLLQKRRPEYMAPSTMQMTHKSRFMETLPPNGAHDDNRQEQLRQLDPWYQSKCLRRSKYEINPIVHHRKQKTLEIAFRRAAENFTAMSKKRRRAPKQELSKAQQCLATVKSLQINLPPRYYVQGDRRIGRVKFSCRLDKHYSGRLSLNRFEEAFKDPLVREIVLGLIDKRLKNPCGWRPIPEYNKKQWSTLVEYYAHCYQTHIYHDLFSVSREYEYTIIPQLRIVYLRAKRRWISALTHTLPSIKDKSVCRRSRMEYARHVLRD
ncbi:hypothetical protein BDB00DRAFT_871963 [Zychaea mexicana]|uniref:uncharacterized protein n=1 Tax=Zychaea mexicana TaxID=64656 RepID=UPI0022FECF44|nr:uncharacterized protein BDB00DRAFT_871963 [Zychaea mexicana]KAI9493959.1 hypothetical protein BDB00DRAFT_871963 [Zychaea mexicana]